MFKQSVKSANELVNQVKDLHDISNDDVSAIYLESTDSKAIEEIGNQIANDIVDVAVYILEFSLLIVFFDSEENQRESIDTKYQIADILKPFEKSSSLVTMTTKFSKQTKDN